MFSLGRRCAPRYCHPLPRGYRSSAPRHNEQPPPGADDLHAAGPYKKWLEEVAQRFKIAKPRQWLKPDTPFPMNPSFRPQAPISDAKRSHIYTDFMRDPEKNSVRALSQRHHISLKRVEAILRLKGMEADYVKNKPRQTGFQWGMEMLLHDKYSREGDRVYSDVHKVDMLEEVEQRDSARQRFQRQYWESIVDDGKEPLLPASLEAAKRTAIRYAKKAETRKSGARMMPRLKDTDTIKSPRQKVQKVERPGRMPIHFVDVGGKFMDVGQRLKRLVVAGRRRKIHARKSGEKVLKGWLRGRSTVERQKRAAVKRIETEAQVST